MKDESTFKNTHALSFAISSNTSHFWLHVLTGNGEAAKHHVSNLCESENEQKKNSNK